MQKLMYAVWRSPGEDPAVFAGRLRTSFADRLLELPVLGLRINVIDAAVLPGMAQVPDGLRRIATEPQMEAVVSLWVHSATPYRFAAVAEAIGEAGERIAGYAVLESEPLRTPVEAAPLDDRGAGFTQLAFIQRSENQDADSWRSRWLDHHTAVAVETQSTFGYRQNLVVHALQDDGPAWAAIVEEDFPLEALTDRHAFYATDGDPRKLEENRGRMSASTRTFIDHAAGLDVLPTSSYLRRVPLRQPL
ncbi:MULTISPECIES: EthD domain-containing protein [unclassified Rhodococcus (in: high G+C Gram-positive bacteria)]|uniref:EthD domain-containing protein n=1 Tax=Rhodococcus sp. SJ-3 TaxID=3454628 RepID=UPI003F7AE884